MRVCQGESFAGTFSALTLLPKHRLQGAWLLSDAILTNNTEAMATAEDLKRKVWTEHLCSYYCNYGPLYKHLKRELAVEMCGLFLGFPQH